IALLAVAASVSMTLVACSGSDGDKPDAKSSGTSTSTGGAVTPGGPATAFPVASDATAQQLPSLGTRKALGYTLTLNSVQRVGPQTGLVAATLTPQETKAVVTDFTEP